MYSFYYTCCEPLVNQYNFLQVPEEIAMLFRVFVDTEEGMECLVKAGAVQVMDILLTEPNIKTEVRIQCNRYSLKEHRLMKLTSAQI